LTLKNYYIYYTCIDNNFKNMLEIIDWSKSNRAELQDRYDRVRIYGANPTVDELKRLVSDLLGVSDSPTMEGNQGTLVKDRYAWFYHMACRLVCEHKLEISGYSQVSDYGSGKNRVALYRV
jgi:hypothetical protein